MQNTPAPRQTPTSAKPPRGGKPLAGVANALLRGLATGVGMQLPKPETWDRLTAFCEFVSRFFGG